MKKTKNLRKNVYYNLSGGVRNISKTTKCEIGGELL